MECDFVSEKLLRKVVIAALKGERGEGGWLKIDAPKATDKEISLAIMEAEARGLVKACDVTSMDSQYPEWKLVGPAGASAQFVRETRASKKVWAIAVAVGSAVVGFLAWLIPIVLGYKKK